MMTFWDYLEQFLALGFLFEDDFVLLNDEEQLVYEAILDPESSVRENMEMMSFHTPEPEESQVLTFDSVKNRQADDRRKKQRLEKIKVSKMIEEHRNRVIDCILNRSLDLAKQVGKRFLTDTHVQREIAYLILVIARGENGLLDYDSERLRRLYKIEKRDKKEFDRCIREVPNKCPDNSDRIDFDAVQRKYTPEGELISDFGKKKPKKKREAYKAPIQIEVDKVQKPKVNKNNGKKPAPANKKRTPNHEVDPLINGVYYDSNQGMNTDRTIGKEVSSVSRKSPYIQSKKVQKLKENPSPFQKISQSEIQKSNSRYRDRSEGRRSNNLSISTTPQGYASKNHRSNLSGSLFSSSFKVPELKIEREEVKVRTVDHQKLKQKKSPSQPKVAPINLNELQNRAQLAEKAQSKNNTDRIKKYKNSEIYLIESIKTSQHPDSKKTANFISHSIHTSNYDSKTSDLYRLASNNSRKLDGQKNLEASVVYMSEANFLTNAEKNNSKVTKVNIQAKHPVMKRSKVSPLRLNQLPQKREISLDVVAEQSKVSPFNPVNRYQERSKKAHKRTTSMQPPNGYGRAESSADLRPRGMRENPKSEKKVRAKRQSSMQFQRKFSHPYNLGMVSHQGAKPREDMSAIRDRLIGQYLPGIVAREEQPAVRHETEQMKRNYSYNAIGAQNPVVSNTSQKRENSRNYSRPKVNPYNALLSSRKNSNYQLEKDLHMPLPKRPATNLLRHQRFSDRNVLYQPTNHHQVEAQVPTHSSPLQENPFKRNYSVNKLDKKNPYANSMKMVHYPSPSPTPETYSLYQPSNQVSAQKTTPFEEYHGRADNQQEMSRRYYRQQQARADPNYSHNIYYNQSKPRENNSRDIRTSYFKRGHRELSREYSASRLSNTRMVGRTNSYMNIPRNPNEFHQPPAQNYPEENRYKRIKKSSSTNAFYINPSGPRHNDYSANLYPRENSLSRNQSVNYFGVDHNTSRSGMRQPGYAENDMYSQQTKQTGQLDTFGQQRNFKNHDSYLPPNFLKFINR
jgi:hypothetical protein